MYRILIRGGQVWDSNARCARTADLAIADEQIAVIGEINPADEQIGHMTNVIDASGCMVFPGLIDMHTHVYPLATFGTSTETSCFASGVTATLDCGSAGADNYDVRRGIIDCSRLTIRTLLNIASSGVLSGYPTEDLSPEKYDRSAIRETVAAHRGEIIGLKVRQGAEIVGELGLKPLEATLEMGEELGLPVMVHCTNPPGNLADLVNMLRRGDVLTHTYMGTASTIIGVDGKVKEALWRARKRGVIMDVANANAHFAFASAERALADGFKPDIISTDQTINSLYRRPNSYNLLHILAKYLCLGLSLGEIIDCVTLKPAAWMGLAETAGRLEVGRSADLAIIRMLDREVTFGDHTGATRMGHLLLKNVMTVKNGVIVYRDQEF